MVHCHPNVLTPRGRAAVFLAVEAGMTLVAACLTFTISRRCYYRWLPRWQAARHAGLPMPAAGQATARSACR